MRQVGDECERLSTGALHAGTGDGSDSYFDDDGDDDDGDEDDDEDDNDSKADDYDGDDGEDKAFQVWQQRTWLPSVSSQGSLAHSWLCSIAGLM